MRIALSIEYDGSEYHGWQAQTGLRTVQQVVETALSRVANEAVTVVGAGRTDTGVHAFNQVVHFDSHHVRSMRSWVHGTNAYLPKDACVRWAGQMPDDFHARYSALSRRYQYVIYNSSIRPALYRRQVTWQYRYLNHEAMQEAAQYLVGEHDFTSFRSTECQSHSPMRALHHIEVTRRHDIVKIDVTANAFLHHMVRNIAGVLMAVGAGKYPPEWVQAVLQAKDRKQGAETAPAYGLYFAAVAYPAQFDVIQPIPEPWLI
ncbi:MAG: tRNA pseudouridine(38-40) synthase TruA [Gammaproteobacteria bacterium]|nr:tRNA pseudouridine(38-40) synthase TruA [Gammaproteobacteria bacterium]